MSSSTSAQTVTVEEDRLAALERRVDQLEDENQRLRAENQRKDERISELEDKFERKVDVRHENAIQNLEEIIIGEGGLLTDEQEAFLHDGPVLDQLRTDFATAEEHDDLRQDLINEQKMRSRHDSEIEQRITTVADEVGVDDLDAELAGDDKLVQLVRNGPDAIADRVYKVHERARRVLQNPEEWGRVVTDKNGKRVRYTSTKVKPYLDAAYNKEFASSEIKRIFEKIEELAEDSPRKVRKGKNDADNHVLKVWLVDGELLEASE